MTFLLRDWTETNTFQRAASVVDLLASHVRDDGVRLEFIREGNDIDVTCWMPDGTRHDAGVIRHPARGIVLTPPHGPEDRQRDAVAFWMSRPSIHYAARELAESVPGLTHQENA
jgi:hypothetical protein